MMSIPIAPLPHGYHQGLGPNGEDEDHDDEEEEEMRREHEAHEREHDYDMDRGGPEEHHMLEHDRGRLYTCYQNNFVYSPKNVGSNFVQMLKVLLGVCIK